MKVEDNLLIMSKILFNSKERSLFKNLTEEQKSKYSFIINRQLSKEYPNLSESLNNKNLEKSDIYNIWWNFFKETGMPSNYWSKSKSEKEKDLKKEEKYWLMKSNGLDKEEDLDYLIKTRPELIKEELKRFKALNK